MWHELIPICLCIPLHLQLTLNCINVNDLYSHMPNEVVLSILSLLIFIFISTVCRETSNVAEIESGSIKKDISFVVCRTRSREMTRHKLSYLASLDDYFMPIGNLKTHRYGCLAKFRRQSKGT